MSNRTKPKKSKKIIKLQQPAPLKLNFGCGQIKVPDFIGVDLYAPGADMKVDLFSFPLPWKDGEVDEIMASHFIEHIPAKLRWPFYDECFRILKPGGILRLAVPSFKSERAYGDMTHEWPPVVPMSWYYLSRDWREANKLTHGDYALKCDFDHQCGPAGIHPEFASRAHEAQVYACNHHWESFQDIWATLTSKKK
jgi:predicted SAM-dependent methyltransferase